MFSSLDQILKFRSEAMIKEKAAKEISILKRNKANSYKEKMQTKRELQIHSNVSASLQIPTSRKCQCLPEDTGRPNISSRFMRHQEKSIFLEFQIKLNLDQFFSGAYRNIIHITNFVPLSPQVH